MRSWTCCCYPTWLNTSPIISSIILLFGSLLLIQLLFSTIIASSGKRNTLQFVKNCDYSTNSMFYVNIWMVTWCPGDAKNEKTRSFHKSSLINPIQVLLCHWVCCFLEGCFVCQSLAKECHCSNFVSNLLSDRVPCCPSAACLVKKVKKLFFSSLSLRGCCASDLFKLWSTEHVKQQQCV